MLAYSVRRASSRTCTVLPLHLGTEAQCEFADPGELQNIILFINLFGYHERRLTPSNPPVYVRLSLPKYDCTQSYEEIVAILVDEGILSPSLSFTSSSSANLFNHDK